MTAVARDSRWAPVLLGLLLVLLAVIQVSLLDFLPTTWAVPDVLVVAVLAVSIARGPVVGALAGAWAGLVLDLIPPAAGPLGGWMLVLAVVAAVLGRVADTYQPGPFAAMALLALAMGAAVLGRAAVLWFAGAPVGLPLVGAALAASLWALLLAPVALLLATHAQGRRASRAPVPIGIPAPAPLPAEPPSGSHGGRP